MLRFTCVSASVVGTRERKMTKIFYSSGTYNREGQQNYNKISTLYCVNSKTEILKCYGNLEKRRWGEFKERFPEDTES